MIDDVTLVARFLLGVAALGLVLGLIYTRRDDS